MDEHHKSILEALTEAGIAHDPASLKKHHTQGIMSSVYSISSPVGDLIVHVSKTTSSLETFKIWEKLKPLSKFLKKIDGIPVAEVLFTLKWPHHFLAVQ